ncbi:DUF393 domain-containing protein [Lysobacter enzymogenes]|nr:DUF393 domain-containing protein [Lysobacter enzymogenes]QCW26139.1 DUF393 domain-containing protein [Lysobacter enzymogenes]
MNHDPAPRPPLPQAVALYDRACPLCRTEMRRLKARDRHGRLRLVDIAAADFDPAQWGFELDALRNALHVRGRDDQWRIGVPGIAEAYRAVGLGWLTWPLRVPGAAAPRAPTAGSRRTATASRAGWGIAKPAQNPRRAATTAIAPPTSEEPAMDLHTLFLSLLLLQIAMGALDTIAHHEVMEKLANRRSAALELKLHSARGFVYGALFLVFAWLRPQGLWLAAVWLLVLIEVGITLWDFVVEDATRLLPNTERVLHTVLAVNGGAMFAVYALATRGDWALPSALAPAAHGTLLQSAMSWALTAAALGIAASAVRDGLAARANAAEPAPRPLLAQHPQQHFLVSGGTGFIGTALVEACSPAATASPC